MPTPAGPPTPHTRSALPTPGPRPTPPDTPAARRSKRHPNQGRGTPAVRSPHRPGRARVRRADGHQPQQQAAPHDADASSSSLRPGSRRRSKTARAPGPAVAPAPGIGNQPGPDPRAAPVSRRDEWTDTGQPTARGGPLLRSRYPDTKQTTPHPPPFYRLHQHGQERRHAEVARTGDANTPGHWHIPPAADHPQHSHPRGRHRT